MSAYGPNGTSGTSSSGDDPRDNRSNWKGGPGVWREECPYCKHYTYHPIKLPCGHQFCTGCLKQAMTYQCGICRAPYDSAILSKKQQINVFEAVHPDYHDAPIRNGTQLVMEEQFDEMADDVDVKPNVEELNAQMAAAAAAVGQSRDVNAAANVNAAPAPRSSQMVNAAPIVNAWGPMINAAPDGNAPPRPAPMAAAAGQPAQDVNAAPAPRPMVANRNARVIWLYKCRFSHAEGAEQKWWRFNGRHELDIEKAYLEGQRTFQLHVAGSFYTIDFATMLQRHPTFSSRNRVIERVTAEHFHEYNVIGCEGIETPDVWTVE